MEYFFENKKDEFFRILNQYLLEKAIKSLTEDFLDVHLEKIKGDKVITVSNEVKFGEELLKVSIMVERIK